MTRGEAKLVIALHLGERGRSALELAAISEGDAALRAALLEGLTPWVRRRIESGGTLTAKLTGYALRKLGCASVPGIGHRRWWVVG